MTLVAYSDSDDDTGESDKAKDEIVDELPTRVTVLKRKRNKDEPQPLPRPSPTAPPPLPSGFTSLYSSTVRSSTNDDPSLHGGRKRQVPHVEGNWPSFIYLEWLPLTQDLASLEGVIAHVDKEGTESSPSSDTRLTSSLRSELGVRLPLHVSLSAPLILTTANKDAFEETLTQKISDAKIARFSTTPSSVRWVKNFDGTRHFLILTLSKPKQNELQSLLSLCNRTATTFRLPQLYTRIQDTGVDNTNVGVVLNSSVDFTGVAHEHVNPDDDKFHISIAWSLEQIHTSQALMNQLQKRLEHMTITFDTVHIKIGNHISSVQLRDTSVDAASFAKP